MSSTQRFFLYAKTKWTSRFCFSEAELSELFLYIRSVLAITSHDWKNFDTLLAEKFSSRTPEALRSKFNSLVRTKPNTGDPDCSW